MEETECMKLIKVFEDMGIGYEYESDLDKEELKTPFQKFLFIRGRYYMSQRRDQTYQKRVVIDD